MIQDYNGDWAPRVSIVGDRKDAKRLLKVKGEYREESRKD